MKVKWGGKDLQERLESYDPNERQQFEPYDGPRPKSGLYGWTITRMKKDESSGGFPCLYVYLELHPRGRADHLKYAGFFMRSQIIVKEDGSTDFKVRPLLDSLKVSVRDFLNNMDCDEDGYVNRIGKLKVAGAKLKVLGNIKPSKNNADYFEIDFYPWKDSQTNAEGDDDSDDDGDDGGKPAPF